MGTSLAQAVTALMGTCARQLSRAARRLHRRPRARQALAASLSSRAIVPFLEKAAGSKRRRRREQDEPSFEAEEDGVWRKEIMMGERCQPLEFSGAIYYDAEGRRLEQPPTPRSPLRSPLPSITLAAIAGGGHVLARS